ncbi:MAG: hypothetical protein ACK456_03260 [Pseudanabaenaceae cyanobacterium]|jgi:uncharacterized protein HemX
MMPCESQECLFRPCPQHPGRIFCTKCGQHFKTTHDPLTETKLVTFWVTLLIMSMGLGIIYFLSQQSETNTSDYTQSSQSITRHNPN